MAQVKNTTQMVTFTSRFGNHRITMEAQEPQYVGNRYTGESEGKAIVFTNGMYSTSDETEIEFLRERIAKGTQIFEIPAQVPDPSDTLVELVTAGPERTAEILAEEQDSWQREKVIDVAREKLALFEGAED